MKRIATQEAVKLSFRITSRGTSACAPARRSSRTKEATRIAAAASSPITFGSPQPQSSSWCAERRCWWAPGLRFGEPTLRFGAE
jgi:hypothetical protein